ncbi:DUF5718 family protein [Rubritalea tangerina]|uniref:DUF5718 family protein n=1 Tax=Rubritalea tangerina TaxID=430798 RepID=A0ABW4ZDV8_9BACT
MKSLSDIISNNDWVGLGIAGNQAEHLDQAGEADDFKDVVALENAPKGIFPWFIPNHDSFLSTNPLSHTELKLKGNDPLQPEPEIALIVELEYAEDACLVKNLDVLGFSAFNDCSRRIAADKISHKKNWGAASQGVADALVSIDDFTTPGGSIENYRIVCYLKRDGRLLQYGCDTAVSDYCYFNQQLVDWIVKQINTQQDHGPLEPIADMLASTTPKYAVIGIGATCYTDFGNSDQRFLQDADDVFVAVYNAKKHDLSSVEKHLAGEPHLVKDDSLIVLQQRAHT